MSRINQILAGVLVVQALLALLLFLRGDDSGIRSLEPLLPDFDPAKVEKIEIVGGKKEDEKEQPSVVLAGNGDEWVVASHFDYPVETQKVDDLLDKVKTMKSRGPVATGKARQKQLEVGDDSYQRKIVLHSAGGGETTFYVGASAGARQTSVRMKGSDAIHGVGGLTAYGVAANPASWVDTNYFTIEDKNIASLEVSNANGIFTLERSDDPAGWRVLVNGTPLVVPADKDLFVDHIEKLASKVSRINLAEPGDPKRAVDKPQATVTIRMKPPEAASQDGGPVSPGTSDEPDEHIIDIADGGAAKDRAYVRVKGSATAVLVSALSMSDIVELSPDKLLAKKGEGKKEAEAPPGGMPPGGMQGMENLPPEVQQQLMEQMMKGQ